MSQIIWSKILKKKLKKKIIMAAGRLTIQKILAT